MWHNWLLRGRDTGELVGTVQATVIDGAADLAWVVAIPHQGRGYAREATGAVQEWLRGAGISRFSACIHPDHLTSAGVARSLGLVPTGTVVDGEIRWTDGRELSDPGATVAPSSATTRLGDGDE